MREQRGRAARQAVKLRQREALAAATEALEEEFQKEGAEQFLAPSSEQLAERLRSRKLPLTPSQPRTVRFHAVALVRAEGLGAS
jgi:hypothetical protein